MIVVAIAGGFGDLGQQFSKALRDTGKYEIIVLKRQVGPLDHRISVLEASDFRKLTKSSREARRKRYLASLWLKSTSAVWTL